MAGVTNGSKIEDLRTYLAGLGNNGYNAFQTLMKALSGDFVLKVTPATATPAPTAAAWTQAAVVTLETADGEVHEWYNGPVTLAIADTSTAGTASITPAAGAHNMTNGQLAVTIAGDAAAWLATETVTLTASMADQDASGDTDKNLFGKAVADKTCVLTFTAP
jgi:hypothetical protein